MINFNRNNSLIYIIIKITITIPVMAIKIAITIKNIKNKKILANKIRINLKEITKMIMT